MSHLTDRDRSIIAILGEHGVLTTDQIARAYFTSLKRAQSRLLILYRMEVLARFRRRLRYGSEQWHWGLAHLGARVHAAATGQRPPRPGVVADKLLSFAVSPQLPHRIGCNDFFIRVMTAVRHHPNSALAEWDSEATASQLAGARLRPDAAATYSEHDRWIAFWFEHDRETERLPVLEGKLDRYRSVLRLGTPRPVLIETLTAARESHLHEFLTDRFPFCVATTHTDIAHDPTAQVWRRIQSTDRHRLIDVARRSGA